MSSSFENSKVFKEHFHSPGEVLVGNIGANGEGTATVFFFLRLRYTDGIILLPRGRLCREEVEDLRTVVSDRDVEVAEIEVHKIKDVPPTSVGFKDIPEIRTLEGGKPRCCNKEGFSGVQQEILEELSPFLFFKVFENVYEENDVVLV